ncbi:kinase-like domain-containing protein [Rhizophagus clarus]|uniref:Kinase-like domain-containing protein n=1 Tax=Rhizophagus clarus TaxID=94130 RepID=A0A8H3M5R3_9GLOM|nr:kinase-like domain-containing protein [Rhizophagus clarus]
MYTEAMDAWFYYECNLNEIIKGVSAISINYFNKIHTFRGLNFYHFEIVAFALEVVLTCFMGSVTTISDKSTDCRFSNLMDKIIEISELTRKIILLIESKGNVDVVGRKDQFIDIKDGDKFSLAIWKEGPLYWNISEYIRDPNITVALKKCLYTDIIDEIEQYSYSYNNYFFNTYGVTQNPNTKDYTLILEYNQYFEFYCRSCDEMYTDIEWCKPCQINHLKKDFVNWTSGNKKIDKLIQKRQLEVNDYEDTIFEWIPYNQFIDTKDEDVVILATWKEGPLLWNGNEYTRISDISVALKKCLYDEILDEINHLYFIVCGISQNPDTKDYFLILKYHAQYFGDSNKTIALKNLVNSHNVTDRFLNEVKAYSINKFSNLNNTGEILKIYGISQNPDTKDYIMVLQHARGGDFNNWLNSNYKDFSWTYKLKVLNNIITGLKEIHQKQMIHRDFHTGNILFKDTYYWVTSNYISDMGLCGDVGNIDETKIYGVMPYVAPEVLRGNPYTQAADIYSFGMIMYFVATDRQPFPNCAHDGLLALDICKGIRPKINKPEAPKCYIDLMKKCWDSNPANRLNVTEIERLIKQFYSEVSEQFKEAEEYRINDNDRVDKSDRKITHPQAIYTSRLLNPFTENLPKHTDYNTECLDFAIQDNL